MQPEATDQYHRQVTSAIRAVRAQVRWKPGKGAQHLRTRQDYGHLPVTATLDDYQAIIASILRDATAEVYVYVWRAMAIFPTVVAFHVDRCWLVMFGLDGVMETAFPPTDPEHYLSDPRFQYLGTMQEVLDE